MSDYYNNILYNRKYFNNTTPLYTIPNSSQNTVIIKYIIY